MGLSVSPRLADFQTNRNDDPTSQTWELRMLADGIQVASEALKVLITCVSEP